MIDVSAPRMLLLTVTSWLDRQEREILAYLIEENRVLRQPGGRHLRLTDDDRPGATRGFRCAQERWAPRRTVNDCADPADVRDTACA